MTIPEYGSWLVWVSAQGGLIALLLLDVLIALAPASVDAELERIKPYLAMLFSFLVPQVMAIVQAAYPAMDPGLWAIIYALGSYAVHEILYRIIQKPDLLGKAWQRVKGLFA